MTDTHTTTPIADILSRKPDAPAADKPAAGIEQPPKDVPGDKVEPPKADTGEPPSPPAKDDGSEARIKGLEAAKVAETRKRQELERKLADLERKLNPPKPDEVPDPLTDKDGFVKHLQTQANVARFNDRLEITTEALVEKEGEEAWEAAKKAVEDRANIDPAFAREFGQGVANARNPARYAFEQGKKLLESSAPKDANVDEIVKKAVAAALEAAGVAKPNGAVPNESPKPRVPPSLADARSAAPGKNPAWEPTPLKDILKRK